MAWAKSWAKKGPKKKGRQRPRGGTKKTAEKGRIGEKLAEREVGSAPDLIE